MSMRMYQVHQEWCHWPNLSKKTVQTGARARSIALAPLTCYGAAHPPSRPRSSPTGSPAYYLAVLHPRMRRSPGARWPADWPILATLDNSITSPAPNWARWSYKRRNRSGSKCDTACQTFHLSKTAPNRWLQANSPINQINLQTLVGHPSTYRKIQKILTWRVKCRIRSTDYQYIVIYTRRISCLWAKKLINSKKMPK